MIDRKVGVGYSRQSNEEQSQGTMLYQPDTINDYCRGFNIPIIAHFADDGHSGRTFNRPGWKELVVFIRANPHIGYLFVSKYDRMVRGLQLSLDTVYEYEEKLGLKIVAVDEPISGHPDSPSFWKQRIDLFTAAEYESRTAQYRTKKGNRHAKSQGRVWVNYWPLEKVTINDLPDRRPYPERAKVVLNMYLMARMGSSFREIKTFAQSKGWNLKGNSAVPRVLANILNMGLTKAPAFLYNAAKTVRTNYEPMVPPHLFEEVQLLLPGASKKTRISPNFPLRPKVKCDFIINDKVCGQGLTGGASKGRNGTYYNYYRCDGHRGNNIRGEKAEGWLLDILDVMSLSPRVLKRSEELLRKMVQDEVGLQNQIGGTSKLEEIDKRIKSLDYKFAMDQIDAEFYTKFKAQFLEEKAKIAPAAKTVSSQEYWALFAETKDHLGRLPRIYSGLQVSEKHSLLGLLFQEGLFLSKQGFRTTKICSIFTPNLLKLNKLSFFEIGENGGISVEIPQGTHPKRSRETNDMLLLDFLRRVA